MTKNIISFITVFLLVATMLVSSGCVSEKKPDSDATNAPVQTQVDLEIPDGSGESAEKDVSEEKNEDISVTDESAVINSDAPQTIPEIVALFNEYANRIKPEAAKVVKNYERRIVDEDKLVVPKVLESTAKNLMNTFMKDDTDPIVYSTREEIMSEYIVPNQSYVSRLTDDCVEDATFIDNGNEYYILIKLKDETNPVTGKGVGSVCDIIEANEVADKAPFIEKFTTNYNDCSVEIAVDKATGRVVHSQYNVSLVLGVTVNLFGTHTGNIGLTFIKDYSITY